jgi:hypothetical protein
MEMDHEARLSRIEEKVDRIYASAEKSRRYILFIVIITLVAFVLPLIGVIFAVPAMLSSYGELLTL